MSTKIISPELNVDAIDTFDIDYSNISPPSGLIFLIMCNIF